MFHSVLPSPIGEILIIGDGESVTALYTSETSRPVPEIGTRDDGALDLARTQVSEYFDGERAEFDLPLAPSGTVFQQQVWRELRRIDYGTTASYLQIAERLGKPTAARAVGMANGRNP